MVITIGSCLNCGMKTLQVLLNFLRMPPAMLDEIFARLGPLITKQVTNYRNAIEPGLKLAMTIRHLATGDRYASMKFDFRVPHNTISLCVREVCQAIINEYKDECMQCPTTVEELRAMQFPQNLVVDGTCLMRAMCLVYSILPVDVITTG